MNMHECYTADGSAHFCLCARGVDHDEDAFDVPFDGEDEE